MRALVIGHFSTVGDIESLEYVQAALKARDIPFDVMPYNPKFGPFVAGAIKPKEVRPSDYTHLIAVCGPFWPELLARRGISLERFAHCTRIGVNLTMVRPVDAWNPFHVLLERDSNRMIRPDITFLQTTSRVPVAGLCTISRQREYGLRQRHGEAVRRLRQILVTRDLASIEIDTRWPRHRNAGGLSSPGEVMSLIERVDLLLTNRLHGLVYALRAGVPVLALDPVAGGDKVAAQAKVLGWPAVSTVEDASPEWIERTLNWCFSPEGRSVAQSVAAGARTQLESVGDQLRAALNTTFGHRPLPAAPRSSETSLVRRLANSIWREPLS